MVNRFVDLKENKRPIVGLAVYDYMMAKLASSIDIDFLLVGDSLAMTVLGYSHTKFVTLEDMIRHTGAVIRGNQNSIVVCDLPDGSYDDSAVALNSSNKINNELGLKNVKIEGRADIVATLVNNGFDVLGHTGLKPQSAEDFGVVGKGEIEALSVFEEAKKIESAGAYALILECVPESLGQKIAADLKIPVIGIGAGRHTDGQILVVNDILGLSDIKKPRFVRKYADLQGQVINAMRDFKNDVINGEYPSQDEIYR
ncbi:3-methyl-2-oxobutanoate hydroxymethyltransferase [Patescibacteria group bacterium]|nr:3-methyl-2-oxobutanoate hydroxymethyltransferase [Patescibacteria group bacterium]